MSPHGLEADAYQELEAENVALRSRVEMEERLRLAEMEISRELHDRVEELEKLNAQLLMAFADADERVEELEAGPDGTVTFSTVTDTPPGDRCPRHYETSPCSQCAWHRGNCGLCAGTGSPGPYRDDAVCPQCAGSGNVVADTESEPIVDDKLMDALDIASGWYGRSNFDSPELKLQKIAGLLDEALSVLRGYPPGRKDES